MAKIKEVFEVKVELEGLGVSVSTLSSFPFIAIDDDGLVFAYESEPIRTRFGWGCRKGENNVLIAIVKLNDKERKLCARKIWEFEE